MNTTVKLPPRERLAAERLHRRWSQLEVADRLGTTPGNVSRWERGITSPGPYFRSKLCELFGTSAQDLGLTWDESDDFLDHNTSVSSSRSTLFSLVGEDLLAHLRTLLRPDPTAFPSSSTSSDPRCLNLPEQEHADQGGLVQAIMQWLQTQPNWVLIVDNAGTVALVVQKE